ncbi:hypothetical protein TcBrA4_0068910 [Trypanosoma cruzi]|nr:hypothetical protein TcBrA4_0068910 [Trypanosoma cruzi]
MLGEWEDLVAKLEKHASQWRRKDAEIATRERDLARRERALEQERQILLQESEHLGELRERLSSMRVTVEERTRRTGIWREAELLARNDKAWRARMAARRLFCPAGEGGEVESRSGAVRLSS